MENEFTRLSHNKERLASWHSTRDTDTIWLWFINLENNNNNNIENRFCFQLGNKAILSRSFSLNCWPLTFIHLVGPTAVLILQQF